MDKSEKAKYEEISNKGKKSFILDKKRFDWDLKSFSQIGVSKEMIHKIKSAAPKKCLSAYMIFVRETRKRIQEENPYMPALQIMKEVGREWQLLDNEGWKRFQEKADLDKYRFKKEKNQFESKLKLLHKNPSCDPFLEDEEDFLYTPKIKIKRKLKLKNKKLKKFKSFAVRWNLNETFANMCVKSESTSSKIGRPRKLSY